MNFYFNFFPSRKERVTSVQKETKINTVQQSKKFQSSAILKRATISDSSDTSVSEDGAEKGESVGKYFSVFFI